MDWHCICVTSLLSLETRVTVTPCSRLCTSAGRSGRTCWHTRPSRRRRRTCSHAWPTSSTPSLRRRRKWASSRPRSSSPAYGKRTVRAQPKPETGKIELRVGCHPQQIMVQCETVKWCITIIINNNKNLLCGTFPDQSKCLICRDTEYKGWNDDEKIQQITIFNKEP